MKNEKLEEFNNYIRFRKVAVIGLGVSNLPLLDYLHNVKARVLRSDGTYKYVRHTKPAINAQEIFYEEAYKAAGVNETSEN